MNKEDTQKRIILKKDLKYVIDEKEQAMLVKMSLNDIEKIRENILKAVEKKELYLDVLEDYLTGLKNEEYNRFLNTEGRNLNTEERLEKLAELEGKCTQMVINIAKGMSTCKDLLGPSIHDTYGIEAKN